ncbi:hypothetical protein [Spongiactinospora sp. 9N601]|uniref:hypothetical protein n=1 Tax=Spongiactinospora sp. 9N601 TaxID=3375149 RepID=UPI00378F31E6
MIEIDGPFHRVSDPGFEMPIPRREGHAPETAEEADATITLPDGARHYATFMTLETISRIMDRRRGTGECANVRQPGLPAMAEAVRGMIATRARAVRSRAMTAIGIRIKAHGDSAHEGREHPRRARLPGRYRTNCDHGAHEDQKTLVPESGEGL